MAQINWMSRIAKEAIDQSKKVNEYKKTKDEVEKQIEQKKYEQAEQKRLLLERQMRQVRAAYRRPGFNEQAPRVDAYSERLGG